MKTRKFIASSILIVTILLLLSSPILIVLFDELEGKLVIHKLNKIPDELKSNDVVYHYTVLSTALEHIFGEEQIRLAKRLNMNDPYEYNFIIPGSSSSRPKDMNDADWNCSRGEGDAAVLRVMKLINHEFKILSLCRNNESFCSETSDYWGFLKPRMWSQYGDSHKGISIALSINKLKEVTSHICMNEKYFEMVDYKKSGEIEFPFLGKNAHEILKIGHEKYVDENLEGLVRSLLFKKHIDYEDENEFRICLREKYEEFSFINIKDCIVGIIAGDKVSPVYHPIVKDFCEKFKAIGLKLKWDFNDWWIGKI